MNFTVLAHLTKPIMRGSNLRQRFPSTHFQLLNLFPHTKTLFIHHHSFHQLHYLFSSYNSSLLLRHPHRHPKLLQQHKRIYFLLHIKWPCHHRNPVKNALQNRIPTLVHHKTTYCRMSQNLHMRGLHGDHNPHRFHFHEPLQQVIQCHITTIRYFKK